MGKLEEIEQDVTKEIKAELLKNQQVSEEIILKAQSKMAKTIRSKYLELLEKKAVALHPPMMGFLGVDYSEKNAEYVRLRNIVLSVFALVESKINYLLTIKLNRGFAEFPRPSDGVTEALNILLDEKNYSAKVEALEKLYKNEKIDVGFLLALGTIRNAFAHALNVGDKKYKFKNRNVATDIYAFDDFIDKTLEIKNKLETISEKQPEVEASNKRIKEVIHSLELIRNGQKEEKKS
jgi:hypothetical protein